MRQLGLSPGRYLAGAELPVMYRRVPRRIFGTDGPDGSAVPWLASSGHAPPSLRRTSLHKATLFDPSLPTSAAQSRRLKILLPAGISGACHHRKAITPMHHVMIMGFCVGNFGGADKSGQPPGQQ